MKLEVSNGEILDKISILQLKLRFIEDRSKLKNIKKEYESLKPAISSINSKNGELVEDLYLELYLVNEKLWEVENKIRIKEKNKEFDEEFIKLARSVYYTNDQRAEIKKKINLETGSDVVEEKSYEKYQN